VRVISVGGHETDTLHAYKKHVKKHTGFGKYLHATSCVITGTRDSVR
jgi:hypothetical protein